MKNIRLGKQQYSFIGLSERDPYFSIVGDGFDDQLSYLLDALILNPATCALDVGANIGLTAAILSQHLPHGHVYAFEPGPTVFKTLQTNITSNNLCNVTPLNFAVVDDRNIESVRFKENSAYGHLTEENSGIEVPATTIDNFVQKIQPTSLDFIKIDVEGFEQQVLKGAAQTISKYNPIIQIEFNVWCMVALSKINGLDFGKWLLETFRHVYLIDRNFHSAVTRIEDPTNFVHDHIVGAGSVDDLLLTNNDLYAPILDRMRPIPQEQPAPREQPATFKSGEVIEWREIAKFVRRRFAKRLHR